MNFEREEYPRTSTTIGEVFDHFGEMLLSEVGEGDVDAGWARLDRALRAAAPAATTSTPERGVRAVDLSRLSEIPGRDLRILNRGDRTRIWSLVAGVREVLDRYPAGRFGRSGSAIVAEAVATVSEALIADRDEHTALRLLEAAFPHMRVLGRDDRRGFRMRRARAEAWSELGSFRRAERLLRRLRADEQRVTNSVDPRTEMLLAWTMVGRGRLLEATKGFDSLNAGLNSTERKIELSTFTVHLDCRRAWLLGLRGRVEESEAAYIAVIAGRTLVLGPDDPETLDARHSLGKMLVLNGEGARAIPVLEDVLRDRGLILGDRHPDTLETSKYLRVARVQAEPRNDRVRIGEIEEIGQIELEQIRRRGPANPVTLDSAAWSRLLRTTPTRLWSPLTRIPAESTPSRARERGEAPDNRRTDEVRNA